MLIKKILEACIDINDTNEIFTVDRNKMILNKLTEKFVGVCYHSCLILKINKIIRRSYIYMKDTLDGNAQTTVMFEVDAIVYTKDEIINGCKIVKKEPNNIVHAKSKYAGIQLNMPSNMAIFKENDIVPVVVKLVRYNVNQSAISVLAVPFVPVNNPIQYYNIVGTLTKVQTDNIKMLMNQVVDEEKKIKSYNTSDKKIYNFFVDLLHIGKKDSGPKKTETVNILELINIKSGVVFKPESKYDNSDVLHCESAPDAVDESPHIIFSVILMKYLSNLQTLQDFVSYYSTFAEVQKSKDVWKMYSLLK